jgi:hypothetical protein
MSCGDSSMAERLNQTVDGGSIPTSPLQFHRRSFWVANVDHSIARDLVEAEHYARGASNTSTYLHGLFPSGWLWHSECVGVAWWIPPTKSAAQALAGERWEGVLSLSRLVIAPGVPKNACSFLLSKSVRLIDRSRWHTLVTYADSWRGHTGTIYRAAGWTFAGHTKAERTYTLNGRMVARKAGPKTRTHAEMMALGAILEGSFSKSRFVLAG